MKKCTSPRIRQATQLCIRVDDEKVRKDAAARAITENIDEVQMAVLRAVVPNNEAHLHCSFENDSDSMQNTRLPNCST